MNKKIALFVTGSIAAYKTPNLVRLLVKNGHDVRVAMTSSATKFVTAESLAIVSKNPVLQDFNESNSPEHVTHIELAKWADLSLIVPASANTIAKLANGIADNFVTSTLLAMNTTKIVIPAMNDVMYNSPATTRNINQLKEDGFIVLEPSTGFLAEGYESKGRMPEPEQISLYVESLSSINLQNKNILISAGGTIERIDPVRYISNDSSGKMGFALANVAQAAGANVKLVTTKEQPYIQGIQIIKVDSANELNNEMNYHFDSQDIVIMAAAVSDYHVLNSSDKKIKKTQDTNELSIKLVQNPDILKGLGKKKTTQYLVGFAAETNDVLENANKKLEKKNADMIVANKVGPNNLGFNSDTNSIVILRKNHDAIKFNNLSKLENAKKIFHEIINN